ncbi:protein translocase subunit SecD [Singulisphaera acidiphila]|uniref:Multifunctional fusion protein n=1 Tax=Singulisphaera acidiphila (strain ATCC BAA-1392 / DSM 18658 / VKM B-2454 / MOB10) TaxID=886293 RepID=L0DM50_SINAD|nr:protein translocase subunit SecD [Singulisphaera acidiphila]AGA29766.1 protein-export membrane protein, SecD/SecF family [Singulisphaera acidiphila DSM 18658]
MLAIGYVIAASLFLSVLYALYGLAVGHKLHLKIGVIASFTFAGLLAMWPPSEKLKLGIDLSGGTILVYEAVKENLTSNFNMDELISALKHRVDPQGIKEIPIRKIGSNRLEIILPADEDVDEVKRLLTDVGALEFRILANRKHDQAATERALGPNGRARPPARYKWARLGEVASGTNPTFTDTTITDLSQDWKKNRYAGIDIELTGKDASGNEQTIPVKIDRNTTNEIFLVNSHGLRSISAYRIDYNPSSIQAGDPNNPRPADPIIREDRIGPGLVERSILVNIDRQDVTGRYLSRAYATQDERLQPAVGFVFKREGARKFGQLTREHLPEEGDAFKYQLAILLDNLVMSAPSINSEIRESGIIEGGGQGFRPKEVDYLIRILQEGSLPASLNPNPLQEEKVGPTLGEDTIAKGVRALWVSMLVVPIFMVIYYRFAGVVAVFALVLNMILLIGSMAFMQSTFSLPGLAGLALTIGMAVDANVLVFERMREEKERGANLAQQIRNGFNRAWVTIFDSHVTNLLSSLVLWFVGTEEVKGFALTMIIGMLWNLFTAVFVSRVIFEYFYQRGWIKNLTMMKLMDKSNFDFISPRHYCMAVSSILIILGLIATYLRGQSMYNIDFTGGTLVTIRLNEQDPDVESLSDSGRSNFVRDKAGVLPDVTVESLKVGQAKTFNRFNIRTTDQNPNRVKDTILKAFGKSLERVTMTYGPSKPIPTAAAAAPTDATKTAVVDRFADGRQYELKFNTITFNGSLPPAQVVSTIFANDVLAKDNIANPTSRFEIVGAKRGEDPKTMILRTDLEPDVAEKELKTLAASLQDNRDMLFERITNFGGTVASETRTLALIATVASWLIIIAYLWFRFKSLIYGLAAVLAVVHDVLFTLGAVAASYWVAQIPGIREFLLIEPFKIDLPMIAAFLTLIGFSVNDTIVIFDRIRELKGKTPHLTMKMLNDAINQTLSRTILTSFTAWLVVFILYIMGGEGLHGFAFALVVGFLSGTYSTIYIASPILIDWIGSHPDAAKADKEFVATR